MLSHPPLSSGISLSSPVLCCSGVPVVTVFCLLSLIWKMPSQRPQHLQQQWREESCAIMTSLKSTQSVILHIHRTNRRASDKPGMPKSPPLPVPGRQLLSSTEFSSRALQSSNSTQMEHQHVKFLQSFTWSISRSKSQFCAPSNFCLYTCMQGK